MKSLITYYGGKVRIASQVLRLFPPHKTYVEPFCGGAALLFEKERSPIEILNDKNELLHTLYKVAREQPDELNRVLQLTAYCEADHQRAKVVCKSPKGHSEVEVARCVVIQCRQSFANGMYKGWGFSTQRNEARFWDNFRTLLPVILERLSLVTISCSDAINCFKRWDSPNTLFYCDPPYPNTHQGHYGGYSVEDFANLMTIARSCEGNVVLSGYPDVDHLVPGDWRRVDIQATMSAKKTVGERACKGDKRIERVWIKRQVTSEPLLQYLEGLNS